MADKKIDEVTHDDSIGGSEKFPMDDAGTAKYATTGDVKNYVLAQIAAIASAQGVTIESDGVYLLKDGALKPIGAETLASAVLDYGFGLSALQNVSGSEVVQVKSSGDKKTVTVNQLKNFIATSAVIPWSEMTEATQVSDLEGADLLVFLDTSASGNKKVKFLTFSAYVHAAFASYVASLSQIGDTPGESVASTDVVYLLHGNTARKATVSQIVAAVGSGDVIGPSTTNENYVPQWDSTTKTLKNGLEVVTSISSTPTGTKIPTEGAVNAALQNSGNVKIGTGVLTTEGKVPVWTATDKTLSDGKSVVTSVGATGSDDSIPTEKAVRSAISAVSGVSCSVTTTENNIPQWDSTQKRLKNGLFITTTVRSAAYASDSYVATEKAVRSVANSFVGAPQSHNENAIPQWGAANELKPGKSVVTVLASNGSDDNIPTEKAVRDALPVVATTSSDGLMTAADKTKLNGLVDTSAVTEIGGGLSDNDTVIVKQGDILNKKSLLSRFWTYIYQKLNTVAIDTLGLPTDNTNLNVSSTAHGLCPKLDSNTEHFLRGDGTWVTPAGSDDFTGTDGTATGVHGLVPAPAITDVNKFLNANGTWATPPSAAGVDIPGATAMDTLSADDLGYFYDVSESGYRKVAVSQIRNLITSTLRYDTLFVSAGAMTPSNTNGATPGVITFTDVTHDTMAFPSTADKKTEFSVVMPEDWDKGTIKAKLLWTVYDSTQAETGQHVGFTIGAISYSDGGNASVAPATSVMMTDQVDSANELHRSSASAALTVENTLVDGNLVHFVLTRDADYAPTGGTAMPTEAIVLGVLIQYGRTNKFTAW